tara:strand:- start:1207 stop:1470 length:264 start_codon:yes stop_codon:yes gene_type:complete
MSKILNIFFFIIILIFFLYIYNYYSSNKNIDVKNYNRDNINEIINSKINHLPILKNDTEKVIEFNDGYTGQINKAKPRSFWNLLKPQ